MKTTAWVLLSLILLATLSFAAGIVMEPVESPLIARAGYDAETQMMAVTMGEHSDTYFYKGVPQDIFDAFKAAESKENYYLENIKGKYEEDMAR